MHLRHLVKEPLGPLASKEVGIVTFNHGGSSAHQDTGRDAQALANHFGLITIAADRPTSYRWPRDKRFAAELTVNGIKSMLRLAADINKTADQYNLNKLVLAGRSAGGLGVIELARTKGVAARQLYAAEPVACYEHDPADGRAYFTRYRRQEEALMATRSEIVRPPNDAKQLPWRTQAWRIAAMGALLKTDAYYNGNRWCQPTTLNYLGYIAEHMPELPVHLEFAEHSFTVPIESSHDALEPLYALAAQHPQLTVERIPNTIHRSFDNRAFFAERLSPIVAQALQAT